ncbi:MAG: hypothetical protein JNM52_04775, partial [Betaproteobacteria bacterium]|nr:hypothetical protein [Betaproteobacteria bacterium]
EQAHVDFLKKNYPHICDGTKGQKGARIIYHDDNDQEHLDGEKAAYTKELEGLGPCLNRSCQDAVNKRKAFVEEVLQSIADGTFYKKYYPKDVYK